MLSRSHAMKPATGNHIILRGICAANRREEHQLDSNLSQEVILKRGKTFKKILFCVDFSPFAELLLSCVEEYVNVGMKEIILLHVVEAKVYADYGEGANPAFLEIEREAQELLERLADRIDASRVQVRPMVKAGSAASVIADTAKEEDVSLIFMGAHGKGFLDRFIIGSVSEKVLRLADRPVLIEQCRVRNAGNDYACEKACSLLFENILFANDFSEY